MSQHEFYLSRAAEARSEAEAAKLDNVRDRCLRSEAAFMAMATRALKSEQGRQRKLAEDETALLKAPQDV